MQIAAQRDIAFFEANAHRFTPEEFERYSWLAGSRTASLALATLEEALEDGKQEVRREAYQQGEADGAREARAEVAEEHANEIKALEDEIQSLHRELARARAA